MTAVERIVSGGQTGVDRAALDAARAVGIPHGGWCPRGRRAEDGAIPARYALRETEATAYDVRTERNVLDSDATLILYVDRMRGGTALTRRLAQRHGRAWRGVDLNAAAPTAIAETVAWLAAEKVTTLNVAGPRESTSPGIGERARRFLERLLHHLQTADAEESADS